MQQAQADLARLNRVMLLGEMTASIAHEVNQPIAATVTNAHAGLRWLGAQPPDLEEARQALGRIVRDGSRAGEVIDRIRALVKKVPPRRELLDINEAIREVIALTQTEMQRNGVRLQTRLAGDLPLVPADRIQLQQVIMNLIVNAVEAMSSVGDRSRRAYDYLRQGRCERRVCRSARHRPRNRSGGPRSTVPVLLIRPSPMGLAWDWRSAVRSWRRMADGYRQRRTSPMVPSFASPCRPRRNRRRVRGTTALIR